MCRIDVAREGESKAAVSWVGSLRRQVIIHQHLTKVHESLSREDHHDTSQNCSENDPSHVFQTATPRLSFNSGRLAKLGKRKNEDVIRWDPPVRIDLFGPGMGLVHKIGLAGLWMTLEALEDDQRARRRLEDAGGFWKRWSHHVDIGWSGSPGHFLDALVDESFRICNNGLLWFPALGEPMTHLSHAVIHHEAIRAAHFQVPATHGLMGKPVEIKMDNSGREQILRFLPFRWIAHRKWGVALFGKRKGRVATWLLPGATVRHEQYKNQTSHEETKKRLLCLLYLPVGSMYFAVHQPLHPFEFRGKTPGPGPEFVAVNLEVGQLEAYAKMRRLFTKLRSENLVVAGTYQAAWQMLALASENDLLSTIGSNTCQAIAYGTAPWSRQKTRLEIVTVRGVKEESVKVFRSCLESLPSQLRRSGPDKFFFDSPLIPNLVAGNLTKGRSWWSGFFDLVGQASPSDQVFGCRRNNDGRLVALFGGERKGLAKMIEDGQLFPDSSEKTFVKIFHEAWGRRLRRLYMEARQKGNPTRELFAMEFAKTRRRFVRCKTSAMLREALTGFWAESGGALPSLRPSWWKILDLMDDRNWQTARDLALLALASYSPLQTAKVQSATAPGDQKASAPDGKDTQ